MDQKNQYKNKFDNFIRYSSLGFEMMAIIGIGTFGGYKIDQWMSNNFKAFTLGLMVLSVILAIIYGTRSLLKKPKDRSQK
ncbi:MAG: AtpZ/AtpI family protein [Draconibacterium sp.]|nr:AtpZ/AtpI family protein [Draconibacterium sp.]